MLRPTHVEDAVVVICVEECVFDLDVRTVVGVTVIFIVDVERLEESLGFVEGSGLGFGSGFGSFSRVYLQL